MTVLRARQKHFHTPIEIGTKTVESKNPPDATQDVDEFLEKRRKRLLARAQDAELEKAATQDELAAARLRKEKIQTEKTEGLIEEEDMETTQKKVEDAAEVAAEAVSAGVDTEHAKELASGKKKVVVVRPKAEDASTGQEAKGGWSVLNGKPVKDPEGEYTFLQALKVCELERPKETGNSPIAILEWAEKKGLLGPGKSDEFMSSFMTQLAKQSVDNIVKPAPVSHTGDTDTGLRAEMKEMREQIRLASDPVESAKRVKELYTTFQGLGLIQTGGGGESIETLKEKHRHDEKMHELGTERNYKEGIVTALGDIVERAGRGAAHQYLEEGGAEEPAGAKLDYFTCTEKLEGGQLCGATISMPPGAPQFTCPKCNALYGKGPRPAEK